MAVRVQARFVRLAAGLRVQVQVQMQMQMRVIARVLMLNAAQERDLRVEGVNLGLLAVGVVVGSMVIAEVVAEVAGVAGIERVVVEDRRHKVTCM